MRRHIPCVIIGSALIPSAPVLASVFLSTSPNSSTTVAPGATFAFTLKLTSTTAATADQVSGVTYWLGSPTSGVFTITSRNSQTDGSSFPFVDASDTSVVAAANTPTLSILKSGDYVTGDELGGGTTDPSVVVDNGTFIVADYTFSVSSATAPGIYTITGVYPVSGGYAGPGPNFPAENFSQNFTYTVTVASPTAAWTNGTSNHSWNTAGNWNPSGIVTGLAAVANFNTTGAGAVTLDANETIGKLNINSATAYTIGTGTNPANTLTFNDTGDAVVSPQINIQAGTGHAINAPIAMANGVTINFTAGTGLTLGGAVSGSGTITVKGAGTLTLATTAVLPFGSALSINTGAKVALAPSALPREAPVVQNIASLNFDSTVGSKLDIENNEMIIPGTLPGAIRTDIKNGNIISSLSNTVLGVGYAPISGGTEVRYTVFGDTNLDGSVNFTDLLTLASNYGLTTATWNQGDFNYDSTVNFSDLLTLAANYGTSLTPGEAQSAGISPSFAADWNLAVSEMAAEVPEPGSALLLGVGAMGLLGRRRRR